MLRVRRGDSERSVTVTALRDASNAWYRDWVRGNRESIHAQTNGRVGYVHIPDMGAAGYADFHRDYLRECLRDALIVDVRYNRGGHVSQLILEKLRRTPIGYNQSRWDGVSTYPTHAVRGPMVALTNEMAGSDGDIFSHSFKIYGLGPLIGTRTWGGVIGIWPRARHADGSITTQPEFSYWFQDVGYQVENYGTDPDIEVVVHPEHYAQGQDVQLERGLAEVLTALAKTPGEPDLSDRPHLGRENTQN
jgi:tricorn protease